MTDETLYERLGGEKAIGAVVDEFYDRVLADDRLAPYFEEVDMERQRAHQTAFISAIAGGPDRYEGENMRLAHEHLDIDEGDFGAVAGHLDDALGEFDVADEDRKAVMAAVAETKGDILGE
jgi:hemoglobin